MTNQIGKKIKLLRLQKGIGLNTLAARLEVSPGYLSNLENGKTETLHLSFLSKVEHELNASQCFFCSNPLSEKSSFDSFRFRSERVHQLLCSLKSHNLQAAEFLLSVLEHGIETFFKENQLDKLAKHSLEDYH